MKFWKKSLIALILLGLLIGAYLSINIRSLSVEQISQDIFIIRGVGGNTSVLRTSEGAVVVDSMTFKQQGTLIKAKAEELTGEQVVLLINTHYHLDHTHGNPGFVADLQIVSTDRTLSHLQVLDAASWQGEAAKRLPNDTFTDRKEFNFGDKTIRVIHPGVGHTDGDLIVHFVEDDTLILGDLFFNQHYPNIDLEAGGSVQKWPATLDNVMQIDATTIVPGHGETSDINGLKQFQTFMRQLGTIGRLSADQKISLEDTIEQANLDTDAGYSEISFGGIPIGLDRHFVIRRAWEESNNEFELKN